jgi:hypothetical protein
VGWWQFNEGSGTVAIDSSGNGNNGTIYGASYVPGKYGYALSFNGLNNYVEVPNSVSLNPSVITLTAWINWNGTSSGFQWIVAKAIGPQYGLQIDPGSVYLRFFVNGGAGSVTSSVAVSPNQWVFCCGVFDGSTLTVYVNGVASGTVSYSGSISSGSGNVEIGGNTAWFNGTIDEVQIYNRALSAAEIQALYQTSPSFSSYILVNVPQGMTDFIATLSWQGTGSINATIQTPSGTYSETNATDVYQKTTYSVSGGTSAMLNIKRIEVSVSSLGSSQSWYIVLATSNVQTYQISAETQT